MLTIKDLTKKVTPPTMMAKDIPVCTVFTAQIGAYSDYVFFRTAAVKGMESLVVSLETGLSWGACANFSNYKPVLAELVLTTKQ